MVPWWWLIVAFLAGVAVVGAPVLLWLFAVSRDWDRAWGMR